MWFGNGTGFAFWGEDERSSRGISQMPLNEVRLHGWEVCGLWGLDNGTGKYFTILDVMGSER